MHHINAYNNCYLWLIVTMASEEVLSEDVIIKEKLVICLGGKYGVGKSTIFRILMSEYSGVMRDSLCRETDTDYCEFDVKVNGQTHKVNYYKSRLFTHDQGGFYHIPH